MTIAQVMNIKKFFHFIASRFCIISILTMTTIVFYGVIMRYIFKSAPFWSEEVSRYLLVWTSLLGASIAFENREHVGVEFFTNKLPIKIRNKLIIIMDMLSLVFFLFVIFYGMEFALQSWKVVSPATGINMFFPYLGIPMGSLFCFVQISFNLIQNIYNNKK